MKRSQPFFSSRNSALLANILLLTLLLISSERTFAQGAVYLSNYDSMKGVFEVGGTAGAPAGTRVQVLGGASLGSLSPISTTSSGQADFYILKQSDVNLFGPGNGSSFDLTGYGWVSGVTGGSSAYFQVVAWLGADSYAEALTTPGAKAGTSDLWQQTTGSVPFPGPQPLMIPNAIVMSVTPVPEPGIVWLGLLGIVFCALRRRWHQ